MAKIESKLFGFTRSGDPVNEYILSNPGGLSVSVLDYGAIIKNIIVPARRGPVDVVLDTDTYNEVDDQFALSYLLASIPAIGVVGIWWSIPIGWLLADLAGLLYYKKFKKQLLEQL